MKNNHEVKPLLFINQPNIEPPVVKMQSTFTNDIKGPPPKNNHKKKKEVTNDNDEAMAEKINYLATLPKEIPSVKCEIKTIDKVYVGRVVNQRDHMLEIAMFGRPSEKVDKREIEEINIVGF